MKFITPKREVYDKIVRKQLDIVGCDNVKSNWINEFTLTEEQHKELREFAVNEFIKSGMSVKEANVEFSMFDLMLGMFVI